MSGTEQTPDEEVLRGIVERVTFRNPENGYAVLKLAVSGRTETVTVVGTCPGASVGTNLLVRGSFSTHPKFGRQFSVSSATETAPSTKDGMIKYLASGVIKGIGDKTAERLVEHFGKDTMEVLFNSPERIIEVSGIGRNKAASIAEALGTQRSVREIMRFLIEHNISPNLSSKIYDRYKNKSVEILTQDPYTLCRDMRGVGFITADNIALNVGIKHDSLQRLKAGLYYALERALEDGHCFLPKEQLAQQARTLLELSDDIDLEQPLLELVAEDYLVDSTGAYYLKRVFRAEEFVAGFIAARCAPLSDPRIAAAAMHKHIKAAERDLNLEFSVEQVSAVEASLSYPLLIITGGPGCGKTTVIKALTTVFLQSRKKLLLAAPTGRAAQRMSQVTGVNASTIHRLLKFDPMKGRFSHDANQPLEADVVIIDESSMIDIMLARSLFEAIPKGAALILVGDKDQLPSVGPGRVFADLVSLKEIKSIALSHLFRRAAESTINTIAYMINAGISPQIPEPDGVTKTDAYFIPRKDQEEAAQTIEKLVSDQIPRKFGISLQDITVLTPTNRGPLGSIALNRRLQDCLNPLGALAEHKRLLIGENEFRLGDRVCQRVNNYQIDPAGVFNGDIGTVYELDREKRSLVVELWDGRLIRYEAEDLHQLSLAYAMTVHRSQGAEIPCVVLGIHDSQFMLLERQLLYTGVTRAKKLLIVVGSKRALGLAAKRATTSKRCTLLRERIKKLLS